MSETLETLIDKDIDLQDDVVFRDNAVPEDKEAYVKAIKMQLTDRIYAEVRKEVRDDAVKDASELIEKKAGIKRIKEFKKLAIDGLIVAFFVGLLVNQFTDIIGFFKGSFQTQNIWSTVGITIVLLLICLGIFLYLFISELLKMLGKEKNETN